MYKVERKIENPYTRGTWMQVWTGYNEQDGLDYIQNELNDDAVNGTRFEYRLLKKDGWVEVPYKVTAQLIKVERA